MAFEKCPTCGELVASVKRHFCMGKKSGGGVEGHARSVGRFVGSSPTPSIDLLPQREGEKGAVGLKVGVKSGPPDTKPDSGAHIASRRGRATNATQPATPPNIKREFRRPLAKDADKTISRQKPWVKEGISRATWYRNREKGK